MPSEDLEALRSRVERDPGNPSFPLWVEWLRREGRLAEARRVAEAGLEDAPSRSEGRAALALVYLDLGDERAAREALRASIGSLNGSEVLDGAPRATPALPPVDFAREVGVDEIDQAFGEAEASPELMMSANDIAERVLEQAMDRAPEAPRRGEPTLDVADMEMDVGPGADSEGDTGMDAAFAPDRSVSFPPPGLDEGRRARVVATLESWLQNIRRTQ